MINTASLSDFRKKWITADNIRMGLQVALLAALVGAAIDDAAEALNGKDVCGALKDDFAAVNAAIADLPEMQAFAGRDVEVSLRFDVPKKETGGVFAGTTCFGYDTFQP